MRRKGLFTSKGEEMRLENKIAVVTAAGRGIGRSIALGLAREGADVVANSYQEETTAAVVADIEALGRKALGVAGDITEPEQISKVIEATLSAFSRIDILVNNVGGGPVTQGKPGESMLERLAFEWDGMYRQNLKAPVMMCQAVAPHMIEQKSGKIVNIASVAGRSTYASKTSPVSYRAVKGGLIRYTQSLADELGPYNINVNAICPGYVYTPTWERGAKRMVERPEYQNLSPEEWFDGLNQGKFPELATPTPLMREQTAEDIANAAIFLSAKEGENITGQTLNIDGGRHKN